MIVGRLADLALLIWIFPPAEVLLRLKVPARSQGAGQRGHKAWIWSPLIGPRLPVKVQVNSAFPSVIRGLADFPLEGDHGLAGQLQVQGVDLGCARAIGQPGLQFHPALGGGDSQVGDVDLDFLLRLPPVEEGSGWL